MKKIKRVILIFIGIIIIASIFIYMKFFSSNVKEDSFVYIPTNATYEQVLDSLKPKLKDISSFKFMANKLEYPNLVKAGKYKLKKGDNNYNLVKKLRSGDQFEQNVVIHNNASMTVFAGKVSKFFESDSATFMKAIQSYCTENNISELDELKWQIIPNTYNFYWNTKPEKVLKKLVMEHKKFWNEERKSKANALNLSPLQVTSLASIVQKEASKEAEHAKIAGLYLNRLHQNIKLESDPTVIYAKQQAEGFHVIIKRVLNKDLQIESPYNTYKNLGLPPYPICIPSIHAIDASLSPEKNDYIFMCAQPNLTGYHNFAKTYNEHLENARKYTEWLDSVGIKR